MQLHNWKSGHNKSVHAHPSEILRAIDLGLAGMQSDKPVSIYEAAKAASKHIALTEDFIRKFIRRKMQPHERTERNIEQPQQYKPAPG